MLPPPPRKWPTLNWPRISWKMELRSAREKIPFTYWAKVFSDCWMLTQWNLESLLYAAGPARS